ncbi:hypothetical protein PCL_12107 [Purpureocillium lilacinum]|uniref:Uncharacterized protein n=1 Tax=Purpureocillium lilacinum TaxID=33203 RepID=A0A2U3DPG3_PURLI|nr:hypothetical protein PCL_12107 [Purpureocillium lilacinum]
MPTTPQKRGRPRKYRSKEEKARRDVLAKRARRHLQWTVAHRDVRFQVYQTPASSATENESAGRLGVLADAARRGNISFYLGGKSRSDGDSWAPNMEAVRATIRYAIATRRLRTHDTDGPLMGQPFITNPPAQHHPCIQQEAPLQPP